MGAAFSSIAHGEAHDDGLSEFDDHTDAELQPNVADLTKEIVATWRCIVVFGGQRLAVDLTPAHESSPHCTLALRMPHRQRANLVVKAFLPADMDQKANPAQIPVHELTFVVPARDIKRFRYTKLLDGTILEPGSEWYGDGAGFSDKNGSPYPLAILEIESRSIYISGAAVPHLAQAGLQQKALSLVTTIRAEVAPSAPESPPVAIQFVIRRSSGNYLDGLAAAFLTCIRAEAQNDPASLWIHNSPRAQSFTMGNLVPVNERPNIPMQRAEIVFPDKMSYLVPQVYGSAYEVEFNEAAAKEMSLPIFEAKLIESPNGINPSDCPDEGLTHFMSEATVYVAFIDFRNQEVILPEAGDTLVVRILRPDDESEEQADEDEDEGAACAEDGHVDDAGFSAELGEEDDIDVFDDEDLDDELQDPLAWRATVIDATEITPPGHVTVVLERRRDPQYVGPRADRPFVRLALDTINFRNTRTTTELAALIQEGPNIQVKLSMAFSKQEFKDQVRCSDQLWRHQTGQQSRISAALLSHDPENSPLLNVDLHALKGRSKVNATANFNTAQMKAFQSFKCTPEITLVHGPFGTGKTEVVLAIMAEIISNPDSKNTAMYVIDNNKSADDTALRFAALCTKHKIKKSIIRCHTLKTEKNKVYKYFDNQGVPQERYVVSDQLIGEFATIAFLHSITEKVQTRRERGDPRYVLHQMSLAQAMYRKLQTASELTPNLLALRESLQGYGNDGFYNTDRTTRTEIKLALNDLMAVTIQEADVVICTLAAAAKVNLATNFRPNIVVLDEGSRVTEFKAAALFGSYTPAAFIIAADHKQMRTYCASAGQSDATVPYLNPFEKQFLLSAFERFILAGWKHSFLYIQHRSKGEVSKWLSDTFYHGQLRQANSTAGETKIVQDMRDFAKEFIEVPRLTNRYMVNIDKSRDRREEGGTSSYNEAEVQEICRDVANMLNDSRFIGLSILILSFYKRQVAKIRTELRNIPGAERVECQTVPSVQGSEADVVLLSFVKTRGTTFINEPHQLLVACSRARYLLGVYSNWQLVDGPESNHNKYIKSLFSNLRACNHIVDRTARTSTAITCRNCGENGHVARDCSAPKPDYCARCHENNDTARAVGHRARDCAYYPMPEAHKTCRHCHTRGHARANCPTIVCTNCEATGHIHVNCPVPKTCSNCQQEGHLARSCKTIITRRQLAEMRPIQQQEHIPEEEQEEIGAEDQDGWNSEPAGETQGGPDHGWNSEPAGETQGGPDHGWNSEPAGETQGGPDHGWNSEPAGETQGGPDHGWNSEPAGETQGGPDHGWNSEPAGETQGGPDHGWNSEPAGETQGGPDHGWNSEPAGETQGGPDHGWNSEPAGETQGGPDHGWNSEPAGETQGGPDHGWNSETAAGETQGGPDHGWNSETAAGETQGGPDHGWNSETAAVLANAKDEANADVSAEMMEG